MANGNKGKKRKQADDLESSIDERVRNQVRPFLEEIGRLITGLSEAITLLNKLINEKASPVGNSLQNQLSYAQVASAVSQTLRDQSSVSTTAVILGLPRGDTNGVCDRSLIDNIVSHSNTTKPTSTRRANSSHPNPPLFLSFNSQPERDAVVRVQNPQILC